VPCVVPLKTEEREREWEVEIIDEWVKVKNQERSDRKLIGGGRKSGVLAEGSQASPTRFYQSRVKVKKAEA
jgi:hypothetical protein